MKIDIFQLCNTDPCPQWSPWSPFGECSATCGGGTYIRNRRCLFGLIGGPGCMGDSIEAATCNLQVLDLSAIFV